MVHAMEAVKSGELKVHQAVREFGVPLITLKDRISGRVRYGGNPGPEPYLTNDEESSLARFLITSCKLGHGKPKQEVFVL